MGLFEGLKGFEIILAGLGIVLFVVLLFILVYSVLQDRPLKYVLPFFLIPIVMIGFPAIKKIQFGNNVIELKEAIATLEDNPNDSEAFSSLQNNLSRIEQFPNLSAGTIYDLAIAKAVLGDNDAAYALADSAMRMQPSLERELLWPDIYLSEPGAGAAAAAEMEAGEFEPAEVQPASEEP